MSEPTAGVNPIDAMSAAQRAETMAEAMLGLESTFNELMDQLSEAVGEHVRGGVNDFQEDHVGDIQRVAENGIALATQVQGADIEITQSDIDNAEEFRGAWPDIPRIN